MKTILLLPNLLVVLCLLGPSRIFSMLIIEEEEFRALQSDLANLRDENMNQVNTLKAIIHDLDLRVENLEIRNNNDFVKLEIGRPSASYQNISISAHSLLVSALAVTNDYLLSGSYDGTIKLWDLLSGGKQMKILIKNLGIITSIDIAKETIVAGTNYGSVYIWSLPYLKLEKQLKLDDEFSFSLLNKHNPKQFITGNKSGFLSVWSLENGKLIDQLKAHDSQIMSLALTNKRILISGDNNDTVKTWKVEESGKLSRVQTLPAKGNSFPLVIDEAREVVITCDDSGTIILRDINSQAIRKQIKTNTNHLTPLLVDRNLLYTTSTFDLSIQVWHLETEKLVKKSYLSDDVFNRLVISNNQIVGGTVLGSVKVLSADNYSSSQ